MVDQSQLPQVNALMNEFMTNSQAMKNFDAGGRIISIYVSDGTEVQGRPPIGVSVSTSYISYPPQMVTSIKASFEERQREIIGELEALGVTGFEKRR